MWFFLLSGKLCPPNFNQHRQNRDANDAENNDFEVVFDNGNLTEEIACERKAAYPNRTAEKAVPQKTAVGHVAHTGHKRGKGAYDGHKTRDHQGAATVFFIELLGLVDVAAFQKPVVAGKYLFTEVPAKEVVDMVAYDGRAKQQTDQYPNIQDARFGGDGACGKKQGVAGQERRDHQTRFAKNNQEKDEIRLPLVLGHDVFQMNIEVAYEIQQLRE